MVLPVVGVETEVADPAGIAALVAGIGLGAATVAVEIVVGRAVLV
jgi:hypothetical protein